MTFLNDKSTSYKKVFQMPLNNKLLKTEGGLNKILFLLDKKYFKK